MSAIQTGRRRRALFWLLLAGGGGVLAALLLEAGALAHFAWTRGGLYYTARPPAPVSNPAEADSRAGARTLHPYFGFAVRPGEGVFDLRPSRFVGARDPGLPAWAKLRANNFGFYAQSDYPVRDDALCLVGVFGGSLAHSLVLQSGELMEQRLAALPALGGCRVRVLNFASGSYKQPQQLLILAYFLALGQRFDWVVNLDGFNEASLGSLNVARGVGSSMPTIQALRALAALASGSSDPEAMRFLLALEDLRVRREALERARAEAPLALLHLVADARLARLELERRALAERPPDAPARSLLWLTPPLPTEADVGGKLVAEWRRASEAMAALASRAGARYLHVLQPNQNVGAHVFSEGERRIALNPASPYAEPTRALYPRLREAGAELRAAGIDFHDATALFDAVPDAVYSDDCCHLNQRGCDRLAELLVERVRAQLETAAPAGVGNARLGLHAR